MTQIIVLLNESDLETVQRAATEIAERLAILKSIFEKYGRTRCRNTIENMQSRNREIENHLTTEQPAAFDGQRGFLN